VLEWGNMNKKISTPIAIGIILILALLLGSYTLFQYFKINNQQIQFPQINIGKQCDKNSDCINTCCGCMGDKGKCEKECEFLLPRECICTNGKCDAKKDETADWKTYINKEVGIDFALSDKFIEIFGIPYNTFNEGTDEDKLLGFSFGHPEKYQYTGLMLMAYTPNFPEYLEPWPFDGIEDVVKTCPKQLEYNSTSICKIIKIDNENAILKTFLTSLEGSCNFSIKVYLNNHSSSIYKGLYFLISLQDTEEKVCQYYSAVEENYSEKLKSEFYTQSKNIMNNQNLSKNDEEKLNLFNQMLSTFKFLEGAKIEGGIMKIEEKLIKFSDKDIKIDSNTEIYCGDYLEKCSLESFKDICGSECHFMLPSALTTYYYEKEGNYYANMIFFTPQ
jgi:hypothetical protein